VGIFDTNTDIDPHVTELLNALITPHAIKDPLPINMDISITELKKIWNKANKGISYYPGPLFFSTMKACAKSDITATIESTLIDITLHTGYSPEWWQQMIDVMIMKCSGVMVLSGLQTIVLFPPDCNFAFKHIGCTMMKTAEKAVWE
jgi:hypothetical protein